MAKKPKKSKHSLNGGITTIRRGVAIYKTHASPFWQARIWDGRTKKNTVRSSHETSKIKARQFAEDLAMTLRGSTPAIAKKLTFDHYCKLLVQKGDRQVKRGERNANYVKTIQTFLEHKQWGLRKLLGHRDIREIGTKDYLDLMGQMTQNYPDLAASTLNMMTATFRNVLRVALEEGVIGSVPTTPRQKQKDNPRPFFQFYPLVTKGEDAYDKICKAADALAKQHQAFISQAEANKTPRTILDRKLRVSPITAELRDLIMFTTNSFVRPTTSELYALTHADLAIATNPSRLLVTIRDGKTGFRVASTMEAAVGIYRKIKIRYPNHKPDDHIFYPNLKNRNTVRDMVQRQFRMVLDQAGLSGGGANSKKYTIYSLRHTAICMRIIKGAGQVDIYTLAKNAGTSVDQIERFYAKHLPISPELARNLQQFVKP